MRASKEGVYQFTFRKSLPNLRSPFAPSSNPASSFVLIAQALYLSSGVFQVLATQFLHYEGAAEGKTLLTVTSAYVGMALVWFSSKSPKRTDLLLDQKKIFFVAFLDLIGFTILTTALFFIGSGIYQVIYSSVVIFTALLSHLFLKKHLYTSQWLSIVTVSLGLSISALGSDWGGDSDDADYIMGMGLALIGTFIYACIYVLNEKFLSGSPSIPPEVLCYHIGFYGSVLCSIYLFLFTLPNWHFLVAQSIEAHAGNPSRVFFLYILLIAASYIHNKAYFQLVGSIGAVSTGVLQAMRAVCVFLFSAYLFCDLETSQCFSLYKGLSVTVVSLGVIAYSTSSATSPNLATSSSGESLPSFSRGSLNIPILQLGMDQGTSSALSPSQAGGMSPLKNNLIFSV